MGVLQSLCFCECINPFFKLALKYVMHPVAKCYISTRASRKFFFLYCISAWFALCVCSGATWVFPDRIFRLCFFSFAQYFRYAWQWSFHTAGCSCTKLPWVSFHTFHPFAWMCVWWCGDLRLTLLCLCSLEVQYYAIDWLEVNFSASEQRL